MANSQPQPFVYKGIAQKKDPAQFAPGEYYQAENVFAQQEGALTARTGHQELTKVSLANTILSISKLNIATGVDNSNPRYMGSGTSIYRDLPPYSSNTSVYSGLTSGQRWSAEQYNTGVAGTPSLYIASYGQNDNPGSGAVRDNGTYATLQKWGIDPPPVPVQATPVYPAPLFLATLSGSTTRFIANVNANASGLKTVTAINLANPGYTQFVPTPPGGADDTNGVDGIYVGMILEVTDSSSGALDEAIIVLAVDSVSFYAVTANAHIAANVTLGWIQRAITTIFGVETFSITGITVNAAFNGTPDNGYSTDDNFHIALDSTDVTNVTQIEIRIVPNFSGSPGTSTDYYKYDIVPAALMSVGTTDSPAWIELNIPKNAFTNVGNAGAGAYTWLNITEIDIVVTANKNGASQTVGFSSIYFLGGGGLNSTAAGTTLYDYMMAFVNPTSGAIGNPSPLMITPNIPPGVTNGKMTLTLTGTQQAATTANGIGEIIGPGSIKIYRRGGTFSDGFYRHIGYAANPGSGSTVTFVDNASDASLDTADTLQFDNDPPVPSSLPVALTASILHFQPSGGGMDYATSSQANGGASSAITTNHITRVVLSDLPTTFVAADIANAATIYCITVGSTVDIGFGVTFEQCIITSVEYGTTGHATSAWFEVYLQYNHNVTATDPSETIEIDSILRGRCNLVHQDFDCIFLAGDANNPSTLYQSKVGRPEAFPVVNLENEFAQQINVGSPSNPINGITSIGPGEIVCLNQDNLWIVQYWAGQLQQPIQSPATRGLFAKFCWCKGDNRIWYLAYDGIYAWAGGESQKASEQIDYLFKNQTVNGIPPINMANASLFSFSYAENSLYFTYADTNNLYHRLKFETRYNRWTIETIIDGTGAVYGLTALFTEPDTGNFLVAVTNASSQSFLWLCDFYSTTDGWVTVPTDGVPIKYTAWRYWPVEDPTGDYQVNEIELELVNPADAVQALLYYNYSTSPTNTINIPAGAQAIRGRYFYSVNSTESFDSNSSPAQYAIGLKLTGTTGEAGLTAFYLFQFRNYPYTDDGYPGPKTYGWLNVEANTNGVSVPMQLQLDGTVANAFNITGTFFNRSNIITLPSNITGVQRRVVPVAGTGGTLQIYQVTPKFEKLPMPLTHLDSLMQVYGSAGWKYLWQVWLDFQCAVPVIFSIYVDGNILFYQATVPANVQRAVSRFYLPPVWNPSSPSTWIFNKSKSYRFLLDSQDGTTTFQLYRDGSRMEVRQLDGDQRSGFSQVVIWTEMPLQS